MSNKFVYDVFYVEIPEDLGTGQAWGLREQGLAAIAEAEDRTRIWTDRADWTAHLAPGGRNKYPDCRVWKVTRRRAK